ncbi:MAG TPA: hypothetical protein V6D47_03640 [Oscillatoriaceae cyanobacterium]
MPREVPPLGPQPQNPGPKTPGAGINTDKKGGGNAGGRRKGEPEPEEPEEQEDEEAQLAGDSLATHRQASLGDFPDQMPWEQSAEQRRKRLEELQQRRTGGPPPAAATGTGKLSLPTNPPRPALNQPQRPGTPTPTNKRLQGAWDPNAAANKTMMAYNTLREQQEERRREEEERAKQARQVSAPLGFEAIAIPQEQPPETPVRPVLEPDVPVEPAAETPQKPAVSRHTGKLDPAHPSVQPITGNRPPRPLEPGQRPPSPLAPRNTGNLPVPPPRNTGGLPPAATPLQRETGKVSPAPRQAHQPLAPQTPAPPAPEAPAALEKIVPKAPARPAGRYRCMYQVVDVATREPVKGARLEFEPAHDSLLPVVNGVSDEWGVYCSNDPPPGYYQVTVRYPGYVPMTQTRYIVDGETDEGTFMIRKP